VEVPVLYAGLNMAPQIPGQQSYPE